MKKKSFSIFAAALIILTCSLSITKADQPQAAVLLYHHILPAGEDGPYSDNPWVVTREAFESQMEYLYNNQYHTVTSAELRDYLYNKKPLPAKSVMITFDDGYLSNYMFAYPILKRFGFKAVVFAITGSIQTKDQDFHPDQLDMLSWMQVAASSDVFDFASHTDSLHYTGADGQTSFISAPADQAKSDFLRSQKRVADKKLFAFPSGQYNAQLVDMLKNNGVDIAFTTNKGYISQNSNPMLLNRVTVYADLDLKTFESVVSCRYRYR